MISQKKLQDEIISFLIWFHARNGMEKAKYKWRELDGSKQTEL